MNQQARAQEIFDTILRETEEHVVNVAQPSFSIPPLNLRGNDSQTAACFVHLIQEIARNRLAIEYLLEELRK